MNGSDEKAQVFNLPPVYNHVDKHGVFPEVAHDETARFNFLTSLNRHLDAVVKPGNKIAFDKRIKPLFQSAKGRDFGTVNEVRAAMNQDPHYQMWGSLKRSAQEMAQQAARSLVLRQIESLADKTRYYTSQRPETLQLDPALEIPSYLRMVDHGGLPGSYYTAYIPDDVANAAASDAITFVATGGKSGPYSDGKGKALATWLTANYPDFKPKRILDIGCGVGHNTLPLAIMYPEATVIGLDVSAPMLRYGHARSVSLGVTNVQFIQANGEELPFEDDSFDWVQSTMVLHETSISAMQTIIQELYRVLSPNGLMLHIEQAQYTPGTSLFDEFTQDWDTFNNNQPFEGVMHRMNKADWMKSAGFQERDLLQFGILPENDTNTDRLPVKQNVFGAWKK
ncbi:class I SAM-dependent methyltransferase [Spirosoma agri]|uniref:Class I SAM-dependent methyltransferase n=1 Tax=Spirosoma agri TaxID=1987381 RepID=A0A6M0ISB0_9BACT|nr:class I SAM-dependent methyltransferase [Spirosoma agri]NEU69893.1 class I SAM-dependent methyltransferase [Spirosoma agri]